MDAETTTSSNGLTPIVPTLPTPEEREAVWALAMATIAKHGDEIDALRDTAVTRDDVEGVVSEAIDEKARGDNFVTQREMERAVEAALGDYVREGDLPDLDDYVEQAALQGEIESVLEETDIVQKVAAGAAAGAMDKLAGYATVGALASLRAQHENVVANLEEKGLDASVALTRGLASLTFGGRLRWLLTGRL